MKIDKPAYRIFSKNLSAVSYSELLYAACNSDIVFFGEFHDNPICHWLELELAIDLFSRKGTSLVIGAEMFDTDTSTIIHEYLSGRISETYFESQCRLWPNYNTDYKPILEFAREKKILFIATNIPRRYAGVVLEKGFEGLEELSTQAKESFPPLPIKFDPELECYRRITDMFKEQGEHTVSDLLSRAQAVKDATMAWSIVKNWSPGKTFFHINGTYHTDNFEGITWYIQQEKQGLKIITISSVLSDDTDNTENIDPGSADYILSIPVRMTRTY